MDLLLLLWLCFLIYICFDDLCVDFLTTEISEMDPFPGAAGGGGGYNGRTRRRKESDLWVTRRLDAVFMRREDETNNPR